MGNIRIIRTEDVERVIIGVPEGHKHLRVCMKLKDDSAVMFQEATMANILRAYVAIGTHPKIKAQELKVHVLVETPQKQGYALHQLLDTSRNQEEVEGD